MNTFYSDLPVSLRLILRTRATSFMYFPPTSQNCRVSETPATFFRSAYFTMSFSPKQTSTHCTHYAWLGLPDSTPIIFQINTLRMTPHPEESSLKFLYPQLPKYEFREEQLNLEKLKRFLLMALILYLRWWIGKRRRDRNKEEFAPLRRNYHDSRVVGKTVTHETFDLDERI